MVEYRDGKKILVTPISAEDLKDVHIGDILYLTSTTPSPATPAACFDLRKGGHNHG